jgi:hypothetical protein
MATTELKETMDAIYARKAEKVQREKAREVEKKETGVVNTILVEYLPSGLYHCRYALGGPVPAEFEGAFTNQQRLVSLATRRWGNADKLKFI